MSRPVLIWNDLPEPLKAHLWRGDAPHEQEGRRQCPAAVPIRDFKNAHGVMERSSRKFRRCLNVLRPSETFCPVHGGRSLPKKPRADIVENKQQETIGKARDERRKRVVEAELSALVNSLATVDEDLRGGWHSAVSVRDAIMEATGDDDPLHVRWIDHPDELTPLGYGVEADMASGFYVYGGTMMKVGWLKTGSVP